MSTCFDESKRLLRNPRVEEAPLGTELMLFDPDRSKFFVLNPTMGLIWKRCEDQPDVEVLARELEGSFDGIGFDAALSDVREAIRELTSIGLLLER